MNRLWIAIAIATLTVSATAHAQSQALTFRSEITDVRAAAESGIRDAMFWMGMKYENGREVPQDFRQAAAWYLKASDLGSGSAMFLLGVLHWAGRGVPQDLAEAHKWMALSAKYGPEAGRERAAQACEALERVMPEAKLTEARKRLAEWEAGFEKRKRP